MDVHHIRKCLETSIKDTKINPNLSESNRQGLLRLDQQCVINNLSDARRMFYITIGKTLMKRFGKDFDKLTKTDVEEMIVSINKDPKYTDLTKYAFKGVLKKLVAVMKGFDWHSRKFPEEVEFIRASMPNNHKLSPKTILTEEEVKKMILSTNNVRDRAIISLLFDSGFRIGELLLMRREDVTFKENGMEIRVNGKTGERTVYPLLFALPYVSDWLSIHPDSNPKALVWIRPKKKNRISYPYVLIMLRKVAKLSGITKPVHPHNFRHSGVTNKYIKGLRGEFAKEYFGWAKNSSMESHYSHLSKDDLYRETEKLYGIQHKEEEITNPIKLCQMCFERNPADSNYCRKCGTNMNQDMSALIERMAKLEELIDKKLKQI